MKFSIVIASYKSGDRIRNSLSSLKAQTFEDFEVLIQESATVSEIACIVDEYNFGSRVSHQVENDSGIYDAWNKAIKRARGDWVLFLGDDDALKDEDTLSLVDRDLSSITSETEIVYGKVVRCLAEDGGAIEMGESWDSVKSILDRCNPIPHQGVFHRRSMFDVRGFDSTFKICADYVFLYPSLKSKEPIFMPYVVAKMAHGGVSTSMRSQYKVRKELVRAYDQLGVAENFVLARVRGLTAFMKTFSSILAGEETSSKIFYLVKNIFRARVY
ncbi:MAG: glycosyltransferase involved in cell wall biosynthesis [Bermanella sp.]|jgi:glycosyltransferase involved in cell wall biosynthesis